MNKCPNCGKDTFVTDNFCNNCGFKINNEKVMPIIENKTKNSKFYILEIISLVLIMLTLGIYVMISCFMAVPKVSESIGGLYVIFGIPIGLAMCEVFPIINFAISVVKIEYNTEYSIIKIVINFLTIFSLNLFYSWHLSDVLEKDMLFYIAISVIMLLNILIFINILVHDAKSNN